LWPQGRYTETCVDNNVVFIPLNPPNV